MIIATRCSSPDRSQRDFDSGRPNDGGSGLGDAPTLDDEGLIEAGPGDTTGAPDGAVGAAHVDGGVDGSKLTAVDAVFLPVSWGNDPNPNVPNGATILITPHAPACGPTRVAQTLIQIDLQAPNGPLIPRPYPVVFSGDLIAVSPTADFFVDNVDANCQLSVASEASRGQGAIVVTSVAPGRIQGTFDVQLSTGRIIGDFDAVDCGASNPRGVACFLQH